MRRPALLLCALLTGSCLSAQVDSVTYGISVLTQAPGFYLSNINPDKGTVAGISAMPADQPPAAYSRNIDPSRHLYYYSTDTALLALDLHSGAIARSIAITNYLNSVFRGIRYDYRDSLFYGLAADAVSGDIRLARLDPGNGLVTPLSPYSLASGYNPLAGTAMDPVHGLFFFITLDHPPAHIITADLGTGSLISDSPLRIDSSEMFGPMEYNCKDSALYGLSGNFSHGRKLGRLDPVNGTVTILSKYNVADTLLNEEATIDPFHRRFYFEAIDRSLRGVDIGSGDLVSMSPVQQLPGTFFSGFIFNSCCYPGSPSGIAEKMPEEGPVLYPDPANSILHISSKEPLMKITFLDFTGRVVLSRECGGCMLLKEDVSGLRDGIYLVKIRARDKEHAARFIKSNEIEGGFKQ